MYSFKVSPLYLLANLFKLVSTNSNSFFVGVIFSIAVSFPTLNNPSPIPAVIKSKLNGLKLKL